MAVLINGNGNEAIYAQQDADWYAALMGGVTMITAVGEQFAYELLDANTIGVKDGVIITKEGRRIQVDTNVIDTFDIPTGAQGTTNYYIIGYHLVTDEESVQSAETFVQLMDNGTDTIPEGSFKEGDDDVYVSLYRVEQNDLTIGTITLLLPTVSDSMQQQITQISNDLTVSVHSGIIAIPQIDSVTCCVNINLTDYGIDNATAHNTFIFVQPIGDYNVLAYRLTSDVQILSNTIAQVLLRATSGASIPSGANMYAYISVHHIR